MFAGAISTKRLGNPPFAPDLLADALLRSLTPLHEPDAVGRFITERVALVQALNWNTTESIRETVPTVCPATGNIVVSWLRLDDRAGLSRQLGLAAAEAAAMTDPDLVLAAFRRWGTDTARHLAGDFAFAVHEPASGRTYLARDRMGIRPLFYAKTDELVAFSTTPASFREIPGVDAGMSEKWLVYYLASYSSTVPGLTAIKGSVELLPGHDAVIVDGRVSPRQYHRFQDNPPWSDTSDDRYVDAYRAEFFRAVGVRLRSAYALGSENSGGLDSASIIAVIRELGGADAPVETFGLPTFASDEPDMRRAVEGSSFGLHTYSRSAEFEIAAALESARILGYPPDIRCTYAYRQFTNSAFSAGVRTMLSGNGGDHFVTSSGDMLFRELALRHKWGLLARYGFETTPRGRYRALKFMAAQHVRSKRNPHVQEAGAYASSLLDVRGLRKDAVSDSGLAEHVRIYGLWMTDHDTANSFALGHRLVGGAVSQRAAESCQVGFSHKVEYRYPMLDPELIQLFLSTPVIEKRGIGSTRHLHRRAMQGVLNESIRTLSNKNPGDRVDGDPDFSRYRVHPHEIGGTVAESLIDPQSLERDADPGTPAAGAVQDLHFRLRVMLECTNATGLR